MINKIYRILFVCFSFRQNEHVFAIQFPLSKKHTCNCLQTFKNIFMGSVLDALCSDRA